MPHLRYLLAATLLIGGVPSLLHAQDRTAGITDREAGVLAARGLLSCSPPPLRDPSTTAAISADDFRGDHFRENTSPDAEVRISWLGATFRQRFVPKVETGGTTVAFRAFAVRRPSRAAGIMAELGEQQEISLGELWCLLRLQPNGEAGRLQTGAPNLFFIRAAGGALWTVDAIWSGAGWDIGASATDSERVWDAGAQVIAR